MFRIIGIAFVGVVLYQLIKNTKPDIAALLLIGVGVTLLIAVSDYITDALAAFTALSEQAGLGKTVFSSLLKIIGIGYITEYSVNICNDSGCSSIGKKIELAGKLTIFIISLPIINGIITTIGGIL
jgi:stage III sporulation protein AD